MLYNKYILRILIFLLLISLILTGEKDAEELKPVIKRDTEHEKTAFHFSGDIISTENVSIIIYYL